MNYQLRCKVFPGQFSNEYAVKAVQANGGRFSLFAPANKVEPDETPTRDRNVEGWLTVEVWEHLGDRVIVKLPRESFEAGWFVTVSVSQLKETPTPARA